VNIVADRVPVASLNVSLDVDMLILVNVPAEDWLVNKG
jgi:hypothetical protein